MERNIFSQIIREIFYCGKLVFYRSCRNSLKAYSIEGDEVFYPDGYGKIAHNKYFEILKEKMNLESERKVKMTEQELRHEGYEIVKLFRDEEVADEEILGRIKAKPELAHVILLSTANLFLESVMANRIEITKTLVEMGADIHLKCSGSLVQGNALNVAYSPEMADYLLKLGIEIEKNLSSREKFLNPAIMAVRHNEKDMVFYWLNKQKDIWAGEKEYIEALIYETIYQVTIMNQSEMLACIMEDDELYEVMKDIYSKEDDLSSIKLILSSLRRVKEEDLEKKKKELRKILNERKKSLGN